jgi:nucleotide-binding universal stress UspA family protein
MARHFQAQLTLLHVINVPEESTVQAGERELASYLAASGPFPVNRVVECGDPAAKITAFIREHNVDLVMMPTSGLGKFRTLLLGSVTAKVLHDVDCTVWTDAHTQDPGTAAHTECRRMLCAIDLVPESADLIRYAVDLAKAYQAELGLVHAAPGPEIQTSNPRDVQLRRNLLEWTRERLAVLQRQAQTNLQVCLECGSTSSVVRGAALHHGADLVVIGRGRGHGSFGRLRSNSYAIICESPCPVLRA